MKNIISSTSALLAVLALTYGNTVVASEGIFGMRATSFVVSSTLNRVLTRQLVAPTRERSDSFVAQKSDKPMTGASLTQTGAAAGDYGSGFNGWLSVSSNDTDGSSAVSKYDSDSSVVSIGADTQINDNLLAGVSFSYDDSEVSSAFNTGGSDGDGYSISPYISYVINDMFSVDASFGYSSSDTDTKRVGVGGTIKGSFDSKRLFYSAGVTASQWYDSVNLSGRVGYLYSKGEDDAFTESDATRVASNDNKLRQYQIGVTASYAGESFMPYASLTYEKDTSLSKVVGTKNDDTGMVFAMGASVFLDSGLSGGISYNTVIGRSDIDSDTISLNIAIEY